MRVHINVGYSWERTHINEVSEYIVRHKSNSSRNDERVKSEPPRRSKHPYLDRERLHTYSPSS